MSDFSSFYLLIYVTVGVIVALGWTAYQRFQDPFHPSIYLGLLCISIYVWLPFQLASQHPVRLLSYLSLSQLDYLQLIYTLSCATLLGGALLASGLFPWHRYAPPETSFNPQIRQLAWIIGLLALGTFWANIFAVGGFAEAYGQVKGGGWSNYGYLREGFLFALPAAVLYLVSFNQEPLQPKDWVIALLFISPLLIQGLLGSRRGPTAMALIGLSMTWFLVRRRRPPILLVIAGAIGLGLLLMFLVTNRGEIYLGSDFELKTDNLFNYFGFSEGTTSLSSNEYVYSGGAILNADIRNSFFWGRRYFTIAFIRPIPKFIWPNKYTDSAQWLGIPSLQTENLGVGEQALKETVGWVAARGSAPGLFADMWVEFSWLSFFVLFGIGCFYGWAWKMMASKGGFWTMHFLIASSLAVFLISQTLEAMLFRYLLLTGSLVLTWRWIVGDFGLRIKYLYQNRLKG